MILSGKEAIIEENGRRELHPREANQIGGKPMVVLIDGTTKSAAEMLAGALRDNKRALLVGGKTFGKGIIQRIWQFDQGTSIKITAARYFLPNGSSIHGVGLKPDVTVNQGQTGDRQLVVALRKLSVLQPDMLKRTHGR